MATTKTKKTTKTTKSTTRAKSSGSNVRPDDYTPQQGVKAKLSLADFEDNMLFAEMRRRGYSGELRYIKVVTV